MWEGLWAMGVESGHGQGAAALDQGWGYREEEEKAMGLTTQCRHTVLLRLAYLESCSTDYFFSSQLSAKAHQILALASKSLRSVPPFHCFSLIFRFKSKPRKVWLKTGLFWSLGVGTGRTPDKSKVSLTEMSPSEASGLRLEDFSVSGGARSSQAHMWSGRLGGGHRTLDETEGTCFLVTGKRSQ